MLRKAKPSYFPLPLTLFISNIEIWLTDFFDITSSLSLSMQLHMTLKPLYAATYDHNPHLHYNPKILYKDFDVK